VLDHCRAQEGITVAHDRLLGLIELARRAQTAEEELEAARRYVHEHEQVVFAMASAGDP
jgi:ribosomal protein L13E